MFETLTRVTIFSGSLLLFLIQPMFARMVLQSMGMNPDQQVDGSAPITFEFAVEDGGVADRIRVPVETIRYVKDNGMQMMMMMIQAQMPRQAPEPEEEQEQPRDSPPPAPS